MGFLEKPYKPIEGRLRKAQIKDPPGILRAEAESLEYYDFNMDVPRNQEILFAQLTWIQIAISILSATAASSSLEVVLEEPDEDMKTIPNHDFEILLQHPNPMQSRTEYLQSVFNYYKVTGNSYTWLNKPGGESSPPKELWPIPSHQIRPKPDKRMYLEGYIYDPGNGREMLLEPWEIMHFKSINPLNRYVGLSPLEAAAIVALGDRAMQKWNTNFFDIGMAKPQGILAYADTFEKSDWLRMKQEMKDEYGGTKRKLMMLQGTGTGDLKWLTNTISQTDMEFLQGRRFNKEELWDLLAPGLNPWLAINSTEANSVTGREAFFELSVYPLHKVFAEKVTNDLLPLYGENLVARFEDVRTVDTITTLKEQEAYERTHTLEEVRKKYYGDDPIKTGDTERNYLTPLEMAGRKEPGNLQGFSDLKAKESAQFKAFVKGRMKDGRYDQINEFKFDYLTEEEQAALKAEIKPSPEMLFTQLREAIQEYA